MEDGRITAADLQYYANAGNTVDESPLVSQAPLPRAPPLRAPSPLTSPRARQRLEGLTELFLRPVTEALTAVAVGGVPGGGEDGAAHGQRL